MKQIVLAMHAYAEFHNGQLPSPEITNKDGEKLLSWRVLLLPYLEEERLFEKFNLDKPWDSPHNLPLLQLMPEVYKPTHDVHWTDEKPVPHSTFYQVIVGRGAAFEHGDQGAPLSTLIAHDGTADTILLASGAMSFLWTKPSDLNYTPDGPLPRLGLVFDGHSSGFFGIGSWKNHRYYVVTANGSLRSLDPAVVKGKALRLLMTRNDEKTKPPNRDE